MMLLLLLLLLSSAKLSHKFTNIKCYLKEGEKIIYFNKIINRSISCVPLWAAETPSYHGFPRVINKYKWIQHRLRFTPCATLQSEQRCTVTSETPTAAVQWRVLNNQTFKWWNDNYIPMSVTMIKNWFNNRTNWRFSSAEPALILLWAESDMNWRVFYSLALHLANRLERHS